MKRTLLMLLVLISSIALIACDKDEELTYSCNDYLDVEYTFTYIDNEIISINGVVGGIAVETENQLITDYYDGLIEGYIEIVDTICVDEYNE